MRSSLCLPATLAFVVVACGGDDSPTPVADAGLADAAECQIHCIPIEQPDGGLPADATECPVCANPVGICPTGCTPIG